MTGSNTFIICVNGLSLPVKGSQLGSAPAPPPRPSLAARMGLPYPDAAQPELPASGVTSLTWTRSSGHRKHSMCTHASMPLLRRAPAEHLPSCSPGEIPQALWDPASASPLLCCSSWHGLLPSRRSKVPPLLCFVLPVFL